MSLLRSLSKELYDVPDGGGGSLTFDNILDALKDDEKPLEIDTPKEKPEEKPKEKIKEVEEEEEELDEEGKLKKDEEEDELKELEEELEEPDPAKLELATPVRRREILKKYPEIFKDFPYLETAYYREQQFTELFPTIDDAKLAKSDRDTLNSLEKDLEEGNLKNLLLATKHNEKAFNKIADDYVQVLADVDQKAYLHVIGNVIKHTIRDMVHEGRTSGVKELEAAAQILNQFAFGTSNFVQPTKLFKEEKPEDRSKEEEINRKEKEFNERQLKNTQGDLNEKIQNSIKSWIDANIDPKKSMTDYIKKTATKDSYEHFERLLKNDNRFKVIIDKLWEISAKNNYDKDSQNRIRSAYISKAKTLLPSVVKKARNDALKGMGKRVREEEEESTPEKTPVRKQHEQSRSRNSDQPKTPAAGMRTIDYLNQD